MSGPESPIPTPSITDNTVVNVMDEMTMDNDEQGRNSPTVPVGSSSSSSASSSPSSSPSLDCAAITDLRSTLEVMLEHTYPPKDVTIDEVGINSSSSLSLESLTDTETEPEQQKLPELTHNPVVEPVVETVVEPVVDKVVEPVVDKVVESESGNGNGGGNGGGNKTGYMLKVVGSNVSDVRGLEIHYNGESIASYHEIPDSEVVELSDVDSGLVSGKAEPVMCDRLLVVFGKETLANGQSHIHDAWSFDSSLTSGSCKYCYYVDSNGGTVPKPNYHFDVHYYNTTNVSSGGDLVEIYNSQLSQQDKDIFAVITELFSSYQHVLQVAINNDNGDNSSGSTSCVFDDYVADIKTVMGGGDVSDDYYKPEFLLNLKCPWLVQGSQQQQHHQRQQQQKQQQQKQQDNQDIVYTDEDRQKVLKLVGPVIDYSDECLSFMYYDLDKEVRVEPNKDVTINGSPIPPLSPLFTIMQNVNSVSLSGPLPEGDNTVRRYQGLTTLSPTLSLGSLYLLQQALDNYDHKRHSKPTSAIFARYNIFKKSSKMSEYTLPQLIEMSGIHPFPPSIIDTYLDVRRAISAY